MSFGLDPELFVVRTPGSRTATSIHLIDFKKKKVRSDSGNSIYSMSKTDGFAVEFTNTPSSCRDFIIPSMAAGLAQFLKDQPNYTLSAKTSMPLTKISTRGKTPVGVCDYGCIPDRSAFTLLEKTPPTTSYHNQMRYIGGHIHMGLYGFPEFQTGPSVQRDPRHQKPMSLDWCEAVSAAHTLMWDIFVGLPMVAMLGHINDYGEALRRTYYGQAGSHRVKTYGVEYRVLSGALMLSPFLLGWALGAMRQTVKSPFLSPFSINYPVNQIKVTTVEGVHSIVSKWFNNKTLRLNDVRAIIDEHNVLEAREYIKNMESHLFYKPSFIDIMIKADKANIALPTNITEAWRLDKSISNHVYPGVEKLLTFGSIEVNKKQFKAINIFKPSSWNTNL